MHPVGKFARSHPAVAILFALGVAINLYGFISDGYDLWTADLMPWIWQAVGAAIFFLAVARMMFVFWLRYETEDTTNAPNTALPVVPQEPSQTEWEYTGDHELLMLFVVDHLLPTLGAQWMMQFAIVKAVVPPVFCDLAVAGLQNQGGGEFQSAWGHLDGISGSPPEFVPFEEMIDAVWIIERGYVSYCAKGAQLVANSGKNVWTEPELSSPASEWISRHASMIGAYEPIRRNSRLGKLFRPRRASLFGKPVLEGTLFVPPGD